MKKRYLLFCVLIILLPCGSVELASLFWDSIIVGEKIHSVEKHYMGKEIRMEVDGLCKNIDVEEYVLGVLPGIISLDYNIETLKMQAILIRTNVLKEMLEKHTCDAADLSYTYLTKEERKKLFGNLNYEKKELQLERAVIETAGKIVMKEDSFIMALYHEVSIGKTASAKEILGEDISYLQSVDSPQDVEAKHYMNIVTYSWEEIQKKVLNGTGKISDEKEQTTSDRDDKNKKEAQQKKGAKVEIKITETTENGFVKGVTVDGNAMTGEEAMSLFLLASNHFYIEEIKDGIRFICLGKGNCLGVSIYGANCLARKGMCCEDIIQYYYKDVAIREYRDLLK